MKMRALNENEIKCEFLSEWDSGYASIYSPCIVNMATKEIVKIYRKGREVYAGDDEINNSNVDDCVDCLDGEYVYMNGKKYPACNKRDLDEKENKDEYYYYE